MSKFFQNRAARRASKKHDRALGEMKAAASSMARSISAMVPENHNLSARQIDKAADDLGRDLLRQSTETWRADGCSDEMIEIMSPVVVSAFIHEFKTTLRAAIPLQCLTAEGSA